MKKCRLFLFRDARGTSCLNLETPLGRPISLRVGNGARAGRFSWRGGGVLSGAQHACLFARQ